MRRKRLALRAFVRSRAPAIGVVVVVFVWWIVTQAGLVGRTVLAGPGEVAAVLWDAATGGRAGGHAVFAHAGATLGRALLGFAVAMIAGTAIGLLLGTHGTSRRGSEPLLELARAVPPVMVFPVFLVAFDFGDAAYVGTIVFGALPVMILSVAQARRRVSPARLEVLRIFSVPRTTQVLAAVMEVLPSCILGARIALSMSLIIAVVTEMIFAPRSGIALGALAKEAEISFETPVFYAAVLLVAAFGYVANRALRALETKLAGVGPMPGGDDA